MESDGYLNLTIGLSTSCLNTKGRTYSVLTSSCSCSNPRIPLLSRGRRVYSRWRRNQSLGMIVGQIAFGALADTWGRHTIYGKELMLTLFGTLMVILLPWKNFSASAVTTWVSVFRVITGIGIGAGGWHDLVNACY